MLNVKSTYSKYGLMLRLPWPQTRKAVFRPSVVVIADAPQCALNDRFDRQVNGTGANGTGANGTGANGTGANGTGANRIGYRVKWKTD